MDEKTTVLDYEIMDLEKILRHKSVFSAEGHAANSLLREAKRFKEARQKQEKEECPSCTRNRALDCMNCIPKGLLEE